jgi:hypothetical protein
MRVNLVSTRTRRILLIKDFFDIYNIRGSSSSSIIENPFYMCIKLEVVSNTR